MPGLPASQEGAGTIALHQSSTGDAGAEESKGIPDPQLASDGGINHELLASQEITSGQVAGTDDLMQKTMYSVGTEDQANAANEDEKLATGAFGQTKMSRSQLENRATMNLANESAEKR